MTSTNPRFVYFRHDLDLAFGGDIAMVLNVGFSNNMREGNVFKFGIGALPFKPAGENQLLKRILASARFQAVFRDRLALLLDGYLSVSANSTFVTNALHYHRAVFSATEQDYWHRLDQAYSYPEFQQNLDEADIVRPTYNPLAPNQHSIYIQKVFEWTMKRINSARSQISKNL